MNTVTAGEQLRQAAEIVYSTDKYGRRGEFGELLLHAVIRQEYNSVPAISKIFLKSGVNDTVKGFDAVHVVATEDNLELWLGEVKFYTDLGSAIRSVVPELHAHLAPTYLRKEFILVSNKLDPNGPHFNRLKRLLDPNTSLDEVFDRIRVPVLLTYNSDAIGAHSRVCQEFLEAFEAEMRTHHATFLNASPPTDVVIHLILVPLKDKEALVAALHEKLSHIQSL